ncbi:MAG TPA: hypothetical protein VG122_07115 [Gemmata sp.]|jgi:hypothetical protein|nr:hypothetical protein [Gemmata sp.]
MNLNEADAEDVAASSAAYAWTLVETISKLPPSEGFLRLYDLLYTTIQAYMECQRNWGLGQEPSKN